MLYQNLSLRGVRCSLCATPILQMRTQGNGHSTRHQRIEHYERTPRMRKFNCAEATAASVHTSAAKRILGKTKAHYTLVNQPCMRAWLLLLACAALAAARSLYPIDVNGAYDVHARVLVHPP